jgi:hypothetical protein
MKSILALIASLLLIEAASALHPQRQKAACAGHEGA